MSEDGTLAGEGELAALSRILRRLPSAMHAIVGPGDDAAVLAAPDGRYVVTTDTMVHGPDFRLAWSTYYDLGWKAAVTNLSDVAAMGAVPTGLVIALAAPGATRIRDLESFADGVREACEQHAPGCALVGGDLTVSETLTVAVTAFGDLGGRDPVLRSGARVGDQVATAGKLGFAGAGIALLFAEGVSERDGITVPDHGRVADLWARHRLILEAQLRPRSPVDAGPEAADAGATAMLDVSDGLTLDASRIAAASGVTIDLEESALTAEVRVLAAADPFAANGALDYVLSGGEDHALLATFPAGIALPASWRRIGVVRSAAGPGAERVTIDRQPISGRTRDGWDPYREWDGVRG